MSATPVNYFRSSNAILRKLAQAGDANASAEIDRRKAHRDAKASKGELGFVQSLLAGDVHRPKAKRKPKASANGDGVADAAKLLGVDATKLAALVAILRA